MTSSSAISISTVHPCLPFLGNLKFAAFRSRHLRTARKLRTTMAENRIMCFPAVLSSSSNPPIFDYRPRFRVNFRSILIWSHGRLKLTHWNMPPNNCGVCIANWPFCSFEPLVNLLAWTAVYGLWKVNSWNPWSAPQICQGSSEGSPSAHVSFFFRVHFGHLY